LSIEMVIFDCDGTLVDSEELGFEVLLAQARAAGVPFLPGEALLALRGKSMATCLATLAERLGRPLPASFEADFRQAAAAVFRERLQPMAGAVRLLEQLRVPCCVASNGPRSKTELTLGITGLLPLFQGRIFSAYEVGSFKPEPGLFLAAARAMGVSPARCAVVEDSLPGMLAGVAAGMQVYAVAPAPPLPAQLAGKVRVLERLEDLVRESWHPVRTETHDGDRR
jgi:HAD superfamily hydrolase (TIGR01509 family)